VKDESKIKETLEPTVEKQSASQAVEWVPDFQDNYLGTPRGFVYIQNKWKVAEKSGELYCDEQGTKGTQVLQMSPQKDMFPEKCSSREEAKEKHVRSASSDSSGSDTVSHEHKSDTVLAASTCSSDIYSDVRKEHLSVKTIIRNLNSQTEKVADRGSESTNVEINKGGNEINYVKAETERVSNVDFECNANTELKVGSTETEHHEMSGNRILICINDDHSNFNTDTTYHKDHSDDTIVTLRKSQNGSISMCSKHEMFLTETESCQVAVNYESEGLSSSQLHNERGVKEVKEETKDRLYTTNNNTVCSDMFNIVADSSAQQETKTLFNTLCKQNMLISGVTNDVCGRKVDSAGRRFCEDTVPHLNRHSDELNLLLAQLAEITSAPLLPQGAASSLVDIPDGRKPKDETDETSQLGPAQPKSVWGDNLYVIVGRLR
jgi:hypothetical protein